MRFAVLLNRTQGTNSKASEPDPQLLAACQRYSSLKYLPTESLDLLQQLAIRAIHRLKHAPPVAVQIPRQFRGAHV